MKIIFNKTLAATLAGLLASVATMASAEQGPALLITPQGNQVQMELLSEQGVTALQYDVIFKGVDLTNVSTEGCLSGLPGSHTGGCNVVNATTMRFVVFSPTNAVLPTGTLGSVTVPGAEAAAIEVKNVLYGDPSGKQIKGDAFVDGGGFASEEKQR